MPRAWNAWYHCTANTYGTWLHGDTRGWRSRHHRDHVDGDYHRPPPPGKYDALQRHARSLMPRPPVHLNRDLLHPTLAAVIQKLQEQRTEIVIASLDDHHLHILARFPSHNPREVIGLAKKHASHILRSAAVRTSPGGIWAKRSKALPIQDRTHQVRVVGYILDHAN
jgi:REP element-mobilizing transposase RayT